jgi:hypothetical protein
MIVCQSSGLPEITLGGVEISAWGAPCLWAFKGVMGEATCRRFRVRQQYKHGQDVLYLLGEFSRLANRLPAQLTATATGD